MKEQIDFLAPTNSLVKRDYLGRVINFDKARCAEVAKKFGAEYWDGLREYGYGGYTYDGRWKEFAQKLVEHYDLKPKSRVLDVGCGKGFLLYELQQLGMEVSGIDISIHAIANAKIETMPFLRVGNCTNLPWFEKTFDFVYSINTLHNLKIDELKSAVCEIERVGKNKKWICVESYRDEDEKANLLYWQLTCESFHRPEGWKWLYDEWGYTGDYGFIYFT